MLVSLGQTDLAQVTALRSILEIEAAGLAARAATAEDLEAMERAQARFEEALARRSSSALEHDLAFHMAVATAGRNNALIAVAVAVRAAIERLLAGAFRPVRGGAATPGDPPRRQRRRQRAGEGANRGTWTGSWRPCRRGGGDRPRWTIASQGMNAAGRSR